MSTISSGKAMASTPHAGSTCAQAAAFPYGSALVGMAETSGGGGYWMVANDGYVAACGDAPFLGQQTVLNAPIVGMAATPDGGGYYLVASDGGVFTFGDAAFEGSPGGMQLNTPVIGMAVDPTTGGYWLVATDGGIFAYGAPFLGSTGSMTLNRPVTGMAAAGDGAGYWLVATDGGVFAYGVPFLGSTGSIRLNKPVVGMASDGETRGYWLVASDGGIFSYGAPFYGSTGGMDLNGPIAGMEAAADGNGYRFMATDGGVFTYGSSSFCGTPVFAPPPPSDVTAVGDSIMVDYQDPLKVDIPDVTVHAVVGRQWTTGESVLQGMRDKGELGREVIVGLGTNGPLTDADFVAMMSILGGASRVVFVNVHVDRPWQDPDNAVLARGATRYPNVVVADWATVATQNPQWFGADGTHLAIDGPGADALAALIASTLTSG
ncbi:MAG TPA: hypothetical protein VH012_04525 [Acidimicrobiales bacterium]|jgi:hypothetical protein|nr:hypothetical protein [Acidimicrobiales bacterium]